MMNMSTSPEIITWDFLQCLLVRLCACQAADRMQQRQGRTLPHAGSPTLRQVVERVKGVVQDAVANADIPFHQVVDAAAVARSAAYTPVFQTQLTLEGWAGEPGAPGGKTQGRMGNVAAEPLPVRHHIPYWAAIQTLIANPHEQPGGPGSWLVRAEPKGSEGAWGVRALGMPGHLPPHAFLQGGACSSCLCMLHSDAARPAGDCCLPACGCVSSPKSP